MDFTETTVYQYHFSITPEIPEDSRQLRKNIILEYQQDIEAKIGKFYNSGYTLYALQEY